jgi:hypothetical protein
VKIPFTLQPRPDAEPATALLLPGTRADDLFTLVADLNLETFPKTYATSAGFLVKLPRPNDTPLAGVVRLRGLSENLLLPVDADLIPPLLPDESQGLVRSRGLVFLPDGRVLEFLPDQPLAWSALLRMPPLQTSSWRSLPEPVALADDLLELTSTAAPPAADAILEQGRSDIGTESHAPPNPSGLGAKLGGRAAYAAGKSLAWLGTKLGLGGLARAGAGLLQRALELIPALSERLMDAQEAALRNLLRDFRAGKIEQALRRALPLNASPSKPFTPSTSAQLPHHSLLYSLRNLLAGRQDPGALWVTPDDLLLSLQAEYRKQAETAARRGDWRRAAFIYGKLLNDLGAAAHILAQGGLHRDAAHIYEQALHNLHAAALQWQAAGDVDKAVELYVRLGLDFMAAEVLRKADEPERALVHYRRHADKLIAQKKYGEAGDVLLKSALRPDLALAVFQEGWQTRPQTTALPCGMALARHYAEEPDPGRFLQILADAEECLPTWDVELTVQFANHLARLSTWEGLAAITGTARDRCLLILGDRMRQEGRERDVARAASRFFPADSPWSAPVARDAQFAVNALPTPPRRRRKPTTLVHLGNSTVCAVCMMPINNDLFLGFKNGDIIHYRVSTGETRSLTKIGVPQRSGIVGLLADAAEQNLIALAVSSSDQAHLSMGSRSSRFLFLESVNAWQTRILPPTTLCATVANQLSPFFGLLSADRCQLYRSDNSSWSHSVPLAPQVELKAALVGSLPAKPETPWCLLFGAAGGVLFVEGKVPLRFDVPSLPGIPRGNTLRQPLLQGWLEHSEQSNLLTVHWVSDAAELFRIHLVLDPYIEQRPQPELLQSSGPILGIQGCFDRRMKGWHLVSLWDSLEDAWFADGLITNPVAAYSLDNTILIVEASGTLTQIPRKRR